MRYRVVYSRRAQRNLDTIYDRVAQDSGEPEIARRLIERILDACDSLARFPQRFAIYAYASRWRMMPIGNYLVFYRLADAAVLIGHVRHAARKPFSS
jgi:plasmid stabilization system protein ParE